MPYDNEYAKHKSISDIANSQKVADFLTNMKISINGEESYETIDDNIVDKEVLDNCGKNIECVISIDGSKSNVSVNVGMPGAEVIIIKVGQTMVDIKKMVEYEECNNPHPSQYNEIFNNETVELVSPGFNICSDSFETGEDFFRDVLFNFFNNTTNELVLKYAKKHGIEHNGVTFLDTYKKLIKLDMENLKTTHPCPICSYNSGHGISLHDFQKDGTIQNITECSCSNAPKKIYITDLLRFHEGFSDTGSNEDINTQLMSLLEKMMLVNLIDNFNVLGKKVGAGIIKKIYDKTVFVMDGPLAIYNYSSWLSLRILKFLTSNENNLKVIGIEKTGNFVQHLQNLENINSNKGSPLKNNMMFYLNDKYIKKYIKYSNSPIPYGKWQYFGKKLFYKNSGGNLFVINHLFRSKDEIEQDINNRNSKRYIDNQSNLNEILYLAERFSSSRYKNALSFVSMAHEISSIANTTFGKRVLDDFVKSNIDEDVLYKSNEKV